MRLKWWKPIHPPWKIRLEFGNVQSPPRHQNFTQNRPGPGSWTIFLGWAMTSANLDTCARNGTAVPEGCCSVLVPDMWMLLDLGGSQNTVKTHKSKTNSHLKEMPMQQPAHPRRCGHQSWCTDRSSWHFPEPSLNPQMAENSGLPPPHRGTQTEGNPAFLQDPHTLKRSP